MSVPRFMSSAASHAIRIVVGITIIVAWLLLAQGITVIILVVGGAVVAGTALIVTGLLLAQGFTAILLIVIGTGLLLDGLFNVWVFAPLFAGPYRARNVTVAQKLTAA